MECLLPTLKIFWILPYTSTRTAFLASSEQFTGVEDPIHSILNFSRCRNPQ